MNKHLNLFYSYSGGAHVEDNVTRSLILTLRQLSPINLRIFLNDIINRNGEKCNFLIKDKLLANDMLGFDIQITGLNSEIEDETDSKLTESNGIILGINWGGDQNLDLKSSSEYNAGGSRPDAMITDRANDISVLIESKTSDWLYEDQIKRICDNFFEPGTDAEKVFITARWTDIVETLQRIYELSNSSVEKFLIKQFTEYLDRINLVDFLEFKESDFIDPDIRYRKLALFLNQLCNHENDALKLKPYGWDERIYFSDLEEEVPENLYFWIPEEYLGISIVCGAGKKWRCQQFQTMLRNNPMGFKKVLAKIQSRLSFVKDLEIHLYTHSKFYVSRFRSAMLEEIGINKLPDEYDLFVSNFTDPKFNSFSWMTKDEISSNFNKYMKGRNLERDENDMFPKWQENEYGQYCHFDIGIHIPTSNIINTRKNELIKNFSAILAPLKSVLIDINRFVSN